eukprot:scaffold99293_cov22-Prasinocladus_malaysianus.AAC.1
MVDQPNYSYSEPWQTTAGHWTHSVLLFVLHSDYSISKICYQSNQALKIRAQRRESAGGRGRNGGRKGGRSRYMRQHFPFFDEELRFHRKHNVCAGRGPLLPSRQGAIMIASNAGSASMALSPQRASEEDQGG